MKKHIALVSKGALRPPLPAQSDAGIIGPCPDPFYEFCLKIMPGDKGQYCRPTIYC